MAQLKDIKDRIDSVKKTRKMTQAMKMVAAAKFKRFSDKAVSSRLIIKEIISVLQHITAEENGLFNSDLMSSHNSEKECLLFITGDRGLCGAFNTNVIKYVKSYIEKSKLDIDAIVFGRKGIQSFKKHENLSIIDSFEGFQEKLSDQSIDDVIQNVLKLYRTGEYKKISLVYSEFKTAISSEIICRQLLPLDESSFESDSNEVKENIIIEPSTDVMVDHMCINYLKKCLNNAFLESAAAEQGARMASMDAATDNAAEMIGALSLLYNRGRQAQITTELSEIVAGAEALVN